MSAHEARRTVLLTGATGFLGSVLARRLTTLGYQVIAVTRRRSALRRISVDDVALLHLTEALYSAAPFEGLPAIQMVIHTATSYGRHGESADEILQPNFVLASRLLEAALATSARLFINADTLLPPTASQYSASKTRFRDWARARMERESMSFANLRIEQMYGPGDDASKFSAYVIRSCVEDAHAIKLTAGEQMRDFIHVDDVAAAFETLMSAAPALRAGFHEYEVGTGDAISLRDFANTVRKLAGAHTRLDFGALPYRANEVMHCVANPTALQQLGWRCRHSLHSGLAASIEGERRLR